MDEQSGESEEDEVMGNGIGESEMEELVSEWGWRRDKGVDSRDNVKHNGRSDQWFLELEDDEGGRARVTTDEERVLRGRWTEMRLWWYGLEVG